MILYRIASNICWICGESEELTGEHKIKKTDLRRHPAMKPRFVLKSDGRKQQIQGLSSNLLKFPKSICARCNNSTTQNADRSYENFRDEESETARVTIEELSQQNSWTTECEIDFSSRIDLARYFGKHLGCALAYNKFPIPLRLSRFVSGASELVCISVTTRVAPFWFQDETGAIGPMNALGGSFLIMSADVVDVPFAYQSAYMTDGIQFIVKMPLSLPEALELKIFMLQDTKHEWREFDNEERKHRGLPYDK